METLAEKEIVRSALKAVAGLVGLPSSQMWVDYDREADVLYLNFRRPPVEAEGEMTEDGILVRRMGVEVVGVTILDASKRL